MPRLPLRVFRPVRERTVTPRRRGLIIFGLWTLIPGTFPIPTSTATLYASIFPAVLWVAIHVLLVGLLARHNSCCSWRRALVGICHDSEKLVAVFEWRWVRRLREL